MYQKKGSSCQCFKGECNCGCQSVNLAGANIQPIKNFKDIFSTENYQSEILMGILSSLTVELCQKFLGQTDTLEEFFDANGGNAEIIHTLLNHFLNDSEKDDIVRIWNQFAGKLEKLSVS
jgi:hypothetical protein